MDTKLDYLEGARIFIKGIVQGVGFRPFVYNLARQHDINGWVRNTTAGVEVEVEGVRSEIQRFIDSLQKDVPPLAQIDSIEIEAKAANGYRNFEIYQSTSIEDAFQPVSPDVSICDDCLRELFDPLDRRFHYPFINCTNCGPRFTIIEGIPYDRPKTTMADFKMCPDCEAEYNNPLDRRFHAQPIACPVCGPRVWLAGKYSEYNPTQTFSYTIELLKRGKIIAIKGLGGFHLACDATNYEAVSRLRERKNRVDKPFAIMMHTVGEIQIQCFVTEFEQELLLSKERPIVILTRKPNSTIDPCVAPGQQTFGVMLPYTPLHHLLFQDGHQSHLYPESSSNHQGLILVMTSGNLSEEPIVKDNEEAIERLSGIADAFLMHDRPIRTRCDDSVVRAIPIRRLSAKSNLESKNNQNQINSSQLAVAENLPTVNCVIMPVRRSRGYAPYPINVGLERQTILAVGGELKNIFCMTRGKYAFMSQHIGDLENYETLRAFEDGITHFEILLNAKPEILAYDLHPDYLSTKYAIERSKIEPIHAYGVQHHHAHIAACMIENKLPSDESVLGVAFDGTGFGDDGAIWGGEFLLANYHDYKRLAHIKYIPLIGGSKSIREPWRMALAWLNGAGIEWANDLPPVKYTKEIQEATGKEHKFKFDPLIILLNQIDNQINTPSTSSAGLIFHAVASILGIRQSVNYEAQAAIEMESLVDHNEKSLYSFDLIIEESNIPDNEMCILDPSIAFKEILTDLRAGISKPIIAGKFHNTMAVMTSDVCSYLRTKFNIETVCLSGGVWQNVTLFTKTLLILQDRGFKVYYHQKVPCNDGGISLGQAIVASTIYSRN